MSENLINIGKLWLVFPTYTFQDDDYAHALYRLVSAINTHNWNDAQAAADELREQGISLRLEYDEDVAEEQRE